MISLNTGEQYEDQVAMLLERPYHDIPRENVDDSRIQAMPKSTNIDDRRGNAPANEYELSKPGESDLSPANRQRVIHGNTVMYVDEAGRTANDRVESGEYNPQRKGLPQYAVDQDHHVPLVASAIQGPDGKMQGLALDHRVTVPDEYLPHLAEHERSENDYMNDLMKDGMSPQDAYHKAHDWATQRESAGVIAQFGREGQEAYKQHFRDQASIASQPSDRPVHPAAHTTINGLDAVELPELKQHLKEKQSEDLQKSTAFVKSLTDPFEAVGRIVTGKGTPEDVPEAASNFIPEIKLGTAGKALFMGMAAKTFPKEELGEATTKLLTGVSPARVWAKHGIALGFDGKPRAEISDQDMELNKDALEHISAKQSDFKEDPSYPQGWQSIGGGPALDQYRIPLMQKTKLGDILDHPELYKAYPELENLTVERLPRSSKSNQVASYNRETKTIQLGTMDEEYMKDVLIHEIQHAIQHKEGFYGGSSISAEGSIDTYRRVAGEVEARNVTHRRDFYDEERRAAYPGTTEDVPRSEQKPPNRAFGTAYVEGSRGTREAVGPKKEATINKKLNEEDFTTLKRPGFSQDILKDLDKRVEDRKNLDYSEAKISNRVRDYWQQGFTQQEIGEIIGTNRDNVQRYLGIPHKGGKK